MRECVAMPLPPRRISVVYQRPRMHYVDQHARDCGCAAVTTAVWTCVSLRECARACKINYQYRYCDTGLFSINCRYIIQCITHKTLNSLQTGLLGQVPSSVSHARKRSTKHIYIYNFAYNCKFPADYGYSLRCHRAGSIPHTPHIKLNDPINY